MYEAVEVFVNIFQAFAITYYLIKCLGVKEGKNRKCAYIKGVIVTVLYLEIMNRIIFFESVGVLIYLVVSLAFSAVFLCGNVAQKIMYNVVMMVAIVCAAMLGAGIVGVIKGTDFLKVGQYGESSRYISLVLTQVILCIFFYMIIKFKTMNEHMDNRYMMVLSIVPVVSVIICCLIVYQENKSESIRALYTLIAVVGIITVNIINMVLMSIERKVYEHNTEEELLVEAYRQKEKDIQGIIELQERYSKYKHDEKNILSLISDLADKGEMQKIKNITQKYTGEQSVEKEVICSSNVVLNYLLNRKILQCEELRIEKTCIVLGNVEESIADIDMYVILENLIDNAMEASLKTDKPEIYVMICRTEDTLSFNIGNSVMNGIKEINTDTQTTKEDSRKHGYGLKNIKDVVDKYNGEISYEMRRPDYIMCRVELSLGK